MVQIFLEESKNISFIEEIHLKKMHHDITKKALNAKAGSVFEIFVEKFVGHYSKKGSQVTFWSELQVKTQGVKKEKKESSKDNDMVEK